MKYLSVCSGIEAASVAWHQLGWEPVGFAEIEKFPSQVLAHHFPGVKNFGDMTRFKEWDVERGTIDLLVGGTPCQAFSVAGLRKGLADPRGNLALTFVAMVDHYRPEWVVWENVPGVLSSNGGRDFGSFLGALGQLGYGWAYRILDAQYFGVAQRRRRVFVVAHSSGDPRRCASVLFEPESLCGNPAPSREAGQKTTADPGASASGGGCWWDGGQVSQTLDSVLTQYQTMPEKHRFPAVLQPSLYEFNPSDSRVTGPVEQSPTVLARWGTGGNQCPLVTDGGTHFRKSKRAQSVDDDETWVESDVTNTMNVFDQGDVRATDVVVQPGEASAFSWQTADDMRGMVPRPTAQLQRCQIEAVMVPEQTVIGFKSKASFPNCGLDIAPTMSTEDVQSIPIQDVRPIDKAQNGIGVGNVGDPSYTLDKMATQGVAVVSGTQIEAVMVPDVAHTLRGEGFDAGEDGTGRGTPIVPIQTPAMHVRRLTPVECERLQGFPDGWTDIKPNGKDTPDSPRYKALGNSMAVPVMRWIGMRIAQAVQ